MPLTLTSPAFANNDSLPRQCSCDGADASPALAWSDVPDGAVEMILLFEDIDGPGGPQVLWAVYGLDPALGGVEEGKIPPGAVGGKNDYGRNDWEGPCPPAGRPHRYAFTLLAISEPSGLAEGASPRNDLPRALSGKVLAQAQLSGRYGRQY